VSDQRATLFDQRAAITVCVTLAAFLDHCIDHRNADGSRGWECRERSRYVSSRPPMRLKNQENLG
jgi:hypothetical protein